VTCLFVFEYPLQCLGFSLTVRGKHVDSPSIHHHIKGKAKQLVIGKDSFAEYGKHKRIRNITEVCKSESIAVNAAMGWYVLGKGLCNRSSYYAPHPIQKVNRKALQF
jgi:hypothetical protein